MAVPSVLELVSLSKVYGDVLAVDHIDLKIPAGTYCCLLGPSGCGKTSTLRMIAGHESVSSGDVILGARNVTDLAPAERSTAMMFQSYALFPHLSVLDNVAFALKMRGVDKAARHARARAPPAVVVAVTPAPFVLYVLLLSSSAAGLCADIPIFFFSQLIFENLGDLATVTAGFFFLESSC